MARVVVVGGGFAGTSLAARLAKLRHEVVLLEAGDRLGGRLRGHQAGDGLWQLDLDTFTPSDDGCSTRCPAPTRSTGRPVAPSTRAVP
ncbi:FAD-dependent oxidoreductase [Aeromicrobium sp. REDSEA-S32_B7]|uniref:FAD-dependent oxidoreductase n=1 Tax=Aeromicrobium sp. REDSEA-S32_B7 TaxID=1811526 RepID=UPI000AF9BBB4|nr:FAD-dependent oxidoreductase [Aeromicrobium sp. REDSEA-S32_B7]